MTSVAPSGAIAASSAVDLVETLAGSDSQVHAHTSGVTRARILDVALELFAAQGFAATSTRELSERLGFTKAALYYHFRTKDELLDALMEPLVDTMADLLERHRAAEFAATTPQQRRRALSEYLDILCEHRALIGVLAQDPSARTRPGLARGHKFYERFRPVLAASAAPSTIERARARAALGALHAAVFLADPEDDLAEIRVAALAAACGALGIPEPRAEQDR